MDPLLFTKEYVKSLVVAPVLVVGLIIYSIPEMLQDRDPKAIILSLIGLVFVFNLAMTLLGRTSYVWKLPVNVLLLLFVLFSLKKMYEEPDISWREKMLGLILFASILAPMALRGRKQVLIGYAVAMFAYQFAGHITYKGVGVDFGLIFGIPIIAFSYMNALV